MTSPYVTDPKLLAQLEGDGYVSDPALLAQLDGAPARTYPGRHAESSAASPAYKEPSFMDSVISELKRLPARAVGHAENLAAIATGAPAALSGGIGYVTGLTTGDPGFASEMQDKLGGWAYQPRTPEGKAEQQVIGKVLSAPSRLSEAVADKDYESNAAMGHSPLYSALSATATRVAPEALMMVLGGKAGADKVGPVKPKLNLNDKPAGLRALIKGDVDKIAGNNIRAIGGPQGAREQLASVLVSAKPPVPGFPMTAADAVRGTDAGTTIQALQERVAKSVTNEPRNPLGVSQQFENILRGQKDAIASAKTEREAITSPMREGALHSAKSSGNAVPASALLSAIDRLKANPSMRGSRVAGKTLDGLTDHVVSLVDENGLIDPEAAYSVRKEIGTFIDNAIPADPAAKAAWDKSMTGKALKEGVQKAIDSELNKASGGQWKPYLEKFSELSKKIDSAQDLVDNKYSVNQKSDVAGVHGQAENAAAHFPAMFNRTATIARSLLESKRKGLEGKIADKQAQWLQNPTMLAAQLQKGISPMDQMIAARLAALREARLKALAAGAGAGATQTQENR